MLPVSATNNLKMSFVPSNILNILRSLMILSSPVSFMNPMPPIICIDSSQTYHAASEAKHYKKMEIKMNNNDTTQKNVLFNVNNLKTTNTKKIYTYINI